MNAKVNLQAVPRWAIVIGSCGYVGFFPFAPGTAASILAALLYYFITPLQNPAVLGGATMALLFAGWAATLVVLRESGQSDPSFVVADEVAGQWIALTTPFYRGNWLYLLIAFALFRLLDIVKPFPVSYFQQRKGAGYVFMDDLVAAVFANLGAHLAMWLIA